MEITRSKILKKFTKLLNKKEATELENQIFIFSQKLTNKLKPENPEVLITYIEKARSIYENLNSNSYFDTTEAISKKKNIVNLNIKNLRYKTLWKTIKQNQEILDKNLMDLKPTTETDQFLCKKCHNRKTTFYTMQIRSADEAETSFITCLVCNYSWREG